jgi:phosphatidylethanolamine/phosphatidyl-N-methylethanolamine N-methyltransferase
MSNDLPHATMTAAYAGWAPVYDALCGPFFARGRRAAARAARRVGTRILELGVGTGLSFGDYGPENEGFGIDISEPMIVKARRRLAPPRGARVLRSGGEIILVNHFYSERGTMAALERWSARYVGSIGLRPDFPLPRLLQWAERSGGIAFAGSEPVEPLRIFTVVRFRRRAVGLSDAA